MKVLSNAALGKAWDFGRSFQEGLHSIHFGGEPFNLKKMLREVQQWNHFLLAPMKEAFVLRLEGVFGRAVCAATGTQLSLSYFFHPP